MTSKCVKHVVIIQFTRQRRHFAGKGTPTSGHFIYHLSLLGPCRLNKKTPYFSDALPVIYLADKME